MAKLSIFAATLLLLLAISNATIYQTTIITRDDGSEYGQFQGSQSQRCRQQMQSQQFRQCERYIRQQSGQQQGGQGDVLILRGIRNPQQQEQQSLRQCCEALQNMDQQCQCEGLRQIVQRQQGQGQGQEQGQGQGQGQGQREQQQEMMQTAQQLPERCGSGQACENMQVVWF